ncbi:MAG: hypothetical protein HFJ17_02450 [Clostridia bacterium]|nr:hypothetical protein [Clostridia bacterium]
MSENKEKEKKKMKNRGADFFVRLMAGILAIMMVAGIASTVIFYILAQK